MAKKAKKQKATKKKASRAGAREAATRKAAPRRTAKKSAKRSAKPAARETAVKKPAPTRAEKTKRAARSAVSRTDRPAEKKKSALTTVGNIARGVASMAVAAVTRRLPWAKDENDPILLLESDHRHFEQLLKDGEDTTERAKQGRADILQTLTSELNVHEAIEEKILYPALKPHAEANDLVLESYQEHHVADLILKELHEVAKDDEKWGAKFKVLKENIEHHIYEEENKLFPIARGVLPREELLALGARMRALKSELES